MGGKARWRPEDEIPPDPVAAGWKIVSWKSYAVRVTFGGRRLGDLTHDKLDALRQIFGDSVVDGMTSFSTGHTASAATPDEAKALYDLVVGAGFAAGVMVTDEFDYDAPGATPLILFETDEGKAAFIRKLAKLGVPVERKT
jgi:hypothetical protein